MSALLLGACGSNDAQFVTRFGSDFIPARHTVSVLGVYKDGQMSTEAWNAIAPRMAPSLGAQTCEPGYGVDLGKTHAALASAIDDYARDNGPTDELLTELAPAALGDLILVLTVAGRPPAATKRAAAQDVPMPQSGPRGPGAGMGPMRRGRRGGAEGQSRGEDPNVFDMSALLFSVARGRSVALVSMQYSGQSIDDATAKFAAKFAGTLPSTRCAGWNWDADVGSLR